MTPLRKTAPDSGNKTGQMSKIPKPTSPNALKVSGSNGRPYRLEDVERVWLENRFSPITISNYRYWLGYFAKYCEILRLDQRYELTRMGAERFARWWRSGGSKRRGRLEVSIAASRVALHAFASALSALGESLPRWTPSPAERTFDAHLQPFAEHLRTVRGNYPRTIQSALAWLSALERHRKVNGAKASPIQLSEIDSYNVTCRRRFSRATVAKICSTLRAYLRFLYVTGMMATDLSLSVMAPTIRPVERPYPILPWADVQKILHAIDRSSAAGRRDYAILLMMSAYGLGAGEIVQLHLDDIDWRAGTIHVLRPKTGVSFLLPLLPAVARSISEYLMHGRPMHSPDRELFVKARSPFDQLTGSAVDQILRKAAHDADVSAPRLGTHVLRHTHASRQLELGTPLKVIGDILGHRNPHSTSAYTRVPGERLRDISLPVPK